MIGRPRAGPAAAIAVGSLLVLDMSCAPRKPGAGLRERLVVGLATDAVRLDPARATDNESIEISDQIFARLVRFSSGGVEPEPDLATGWSVSPDGLTWTFDLRPNVSFHDGTPVDAEAVVFSFERQLIPSHPFHETDFDWLSSYRNIRRVVALSRLKVQFEIERPYAPFLANLAMAPAAIVSPTAVRRFGKEFARNPVGAGPFRFVEWVPGDRITLERNPVYWDAPARMRYLVFLALPDAGQRLQALESGAIDIMQQLSPDDMSFVRLHPELRLVTVPTASVAYLALNTSRKPFDDPRVRRAVAHAIRRDAIVKFIYQGLAIPAVGPLPPTLWGSRSDVVTYPYDPARARELLEEADFRADPDVPVRLFAPAVQRLYMPAPDRLASIIKSALAEVGMPVSLHFNDFIGHKAAMQNGRHDMALFGWVGDNGDPDNFLYTLLDSDNAHVGSAQNAAFYRSEKFHALNKDAQRTTVRAERERLYSEAQALLAVDSPWVPLAHTQLARATRANVSGYVVQATSLPVYRLTAVGP